MSEFAPDIVPPGSRSEPAWWFAFRGDELLVHETDGSLRVPLLVEFADLGLTPGRAHYLGHLDGRHCYTVELPDGTSPPSGMAFHGLRQVWGRLDEDVFWVAARAVQIVEWDRTHRFCGRCGVSLRPKETERAKECPKCGLLQFPRLSPAVLVLVRKGDQLLLARQPHFAPGYYSIIAGFVEPGETLEETAAREVREEVGIQITDIRYFGSQPWPFPHNLMVGFTALYAGGTIILDGKEIEDARWFSVDQLPLLPGKISLSRKLIDWYLAQQGVKGKP